MKRKYIYTLSGLLLAIPLVSVVYGQYFRPLRIWVDGSSWEVTGPGQLHAIRVSSRLKNSPESDFERSWGEVAVSLWGSEGSVSTYIAPKPTVSGIKVDLSMDAVQFVEATSSSGEQWVYRIQLKN